MLFKKLVYIPFSKYGHKYKDYCYIFGGIGIIYFLASSFFMPFTNTQVLYTVAYLKAGAAILCLGLCMYTIYLTPKQQAKYMPYYWYCVLIYCLPFLSSYIALIYNYELSWVINLVLSCIILYLFTNCIALLIISTIGFVAAYVLFKCTGSDLAIKNPLAGPSKIVSYIYCSLTGLLFLTLQQKDKLHKPDSQSTKLGELQAILSYSSYKDLSDINNTADHGLHSIGECVQEALGEYRFKGHERSRVRVDMVGKNFYFRGSKLLMKHVLMHLIDNSFKHAGPNTTIYIWSQDHELNIRDNGKGIGNDISADIFNLGTAGLPFCKKVIEAIGGTIQYKSDLDKGATFVLSFPKID
jgi:hypothetical protein